jgi:hypothetical protein
MVGPVDCYEELLRTGAQHLTGLQRRRGIRQRRVLRRYR